MVREVDEEPVGVKVGQGRPGGPVMPRESRSIHLHMIQARSSLWSQSGQFWLGAFMVAEVPVGIAISNLPDGPRAELQDWVLGSVWAMVLAVAFLIASGIVVGWVAHRLGLGE